MNTRLISLSLMFVSLIFVALTGAVPAESKGCLKGAAVGAAAGHYVAHHHGLIGAAVGCWVGRHEAKKREREERARQQTPPGNTSNN